jgi:hypothetical protein
MDIKELINHPEHMDKETLYDLRSLLAIYPYYQTARLLMLQNLYLLHDTSFDDELRRAAVYMTDRRVIFQLVEAAHYSLRKTPKIEPAIASAESKGSRTVALIDSFLDSIPADNEEEKKSKRKPTPADAAIDYVAYLLENEAENNGNDQESAPQMKGQSLIDNFINNDGGKIELKETPEYVPQIDETSESEQNDGDEGYFTETLAKIYIKQGRYSKALEIIKRLNLNYPKKNAYFADQMRFLEKLIKNNNNNNK